MGAQRKEYRSERENEILTGLFHDRESAETAYQSALNNGYKPEEITVVMSEETRKKLYDSDLVKLESGTKASEGLGIGSATGAAVGGIIGVLAAVGTNLVVPGLGLVIAGPLVAGLAGAGAGSITGGLIGALIGLGIPETTAKEYEKGIEEGGIMLGVNKKNDQRFSSLENDWRR